MHARNQMLNDVMMTQKKKTKKIREGKLCPKASPGNLHTASKNQGTRFRGARLLNVPTCSNDVACVNGLA